jgi:hypothetical protein
VCLDLHHSQGLFVVSPLSVYWAASNHHLVCLLTLEVFQILLVLEMLELLEAMVLMLHHLLQLRLLVLWHPGVLMALLVTGSLLGSAL